MNLLDIIFPKKCLECDVVGEYICSNCIYKVRSPKLVCLECNKPSIDGFTHTKCQKKHGLNGLVSLWNYDGVIRKALLALKYKYATEVAKELISYIGTELESKKFILGQRAILVSIPLHWYRENYRGFNQSEILGKEVAKKMGWKFLSDLLVKKKLTPPQVGLKGKTREQNIQGVFSLNSNHYSLVPSASFILFDDVCTTGSTLKEAAKVLKRNGAEKVWGLTVAK